MKAVWAFRRARLAMLYALGSLLVVSVFPIVMMPSRWGVIPITYSQEYQESALAIRYLAGVFAPFSGDYVQLPVPRIRGVWAAPLGILWILSIAAFGMLSVRAVKSWREANSLRAWRRPRTRTVDESLRCAVSTLMIAWRADYAAVNRSNLWDYLPEEVRVILTARYEHGAFVSAPARVDSELATLAKCRADNESCLDATLALFLTQLADDVRAIRAHLDTIPMNWDRVQSERRMFSDTRDLVATLARFHDGIAANSQALVARVERGIRTDLCDHIDVPPHLELLRRQLVAGRGLLDLFSELVPETSGGANMESLSLELTVSNSRGLLGRA